MTRDENGRFAKGQTGNPNGRPRKAREERFYEITLEAVTFEDWREIVVKAKDQARRGDSVARAWLGKVLGLEIDRHEISGVNGGPLEIRVVYDDADSSLTTSAS